MSYTDEFLKSLGIKWGVYEVAKNLNYFRRSYASETFWTYYRGHKDELKAEGISVYKLDGVFYVYDWSRTDKATQADYNEQETKKNRAYFNELLLTISEYTSWEPATIEDAEDYIRQNAKNPQYMLNEAREAAFNNKIVYPAA